MTRPPYLSCAIGILRLWMGGMFLELGIQKWVYLIDTSVFYAHLGIPKPFAVSVLIGSTEIICSCLLIVGIYSRFAAIPLIGSLTLTCLFVHLPQLKQEWLWVLHIHELSIMAHLVLIIIVGGGAWQLETYWKKTKKS